MMLIYGIHVLELLIETNLLLALLEQLFYLLFKTLKGLLLCTEFISNIYHRKENRTSGSKTFDFASFNVSLFLTFPRF